MAEWQARVDRAAARPSLFGPTVAKPTFEVAPWRFRYAYRCAASGCTRHNQTIVDWEVVALWRHVRHREDWQDAMRARFERDMWTGKDSVLFLGNMEQHPQSFLVLGVFWPPAGLSQQVLL